MHEAGAYQVTVEELGDLLQRAPRDIVVVYAQVHQVGFRVGVGSLGLVQLLLLVLQFHLADVPQQDGGADDAKHTQGIGAGITVGYAGSPIREHALQRLVGGSKTGGVGDGAVHGAYHHGQVDGVACVEEQVIAPKHHQDVEEYHQHGHQVEAEAALAEALEEARTHLQTYHEDKEYQAEVLYERKDIGGRRKAHVPGQDADEEHEGGSQCDTSYLDLAEEYAKRDDESVEQGDMRHRVRVGKQINNPIHDLILGNG